jgi:hypothetical protein
MSVQRELRILSTAIGTSGWVVGTVGLVLALLYAAALYG